MKSVLFIASIAGHIRSFHIPMLKRFKELGFSTYVACRDDGLGLEYIDKIFDIKFERSPMSLKNIKVQKELTELILGNEFDVISCHTPTASILTRKAYKKFRKKKSFQSRLFYTSHGFHFYNGGPFFSNLIFSRIEKYYSKYTDVLITINDEDFEYAKKNFPCTVKKINSMGIDGSIFCAISSDEKASLRERLGIQKDSICLICIGELNDNKNQSFLLRVFAELVARLKGQGYDVHSRLRFIIAGEGPNKESLVALVKDLGVEHQVEFTGFVSNISDYIKASDIGLGASFREGFGIGIGQEMACGLPVVINNNRGHRELLDSKDLVDALDEDLYVEKLLMLLTDSMHYESQREKMLHTSKKFELTKIVCDLEKIYGLS